MKEISSDQEHASWKPGQSEGQLSSQENLARIQALDSKRHAEALRRQIPELQDELRGKEGRDRLKAEARIAELRKELEEITGDIEDKFDYSDTDDGKIAA